MISLRLLVNALFSLLLVAYAMPGQASTYSPKHRCPFAYESIEALKRISKPELVRVLQAMANTAHETGYREVGVKRDWYHGHVLRDRLSGEPFAILFHTQEEIEPPFNPGGRNWLGWMENGREVENANAYAIDVRLQPRDLVSNHTVLPEFLDPKKLGHEILGYAERDGQFDFTRGRCGKNPTGSDARSNQFYLEVPGHGRVCLELLPDDCGEDGTGCPSCL